MATNFNLRLDDQLKMESFEIIEQFGLTPSQFMRLVLKQVADTGSLPLSFEKRPHYRKLNANGERLLRESIADFENGDCSEYHTVDELAHAITEATRG